MEQNLQIIEKNLNKPVVFVGLMGAGKTEIGRRLAQAVNCNFYDSDEVIVAREGMSVSDIFQKSGENYFRQCEKEVIAELLSEKRIILSPGGGAIMQPETAALMKEKALVVWLDADTQTLVDRVAGNDKRPLLVGKDPHTVLKALFEERAPLYQTANIHVDANGSIDDVLQKTIEGIQQHLKL